VKNFPRVRHIPHGLPTQHQGMKVEVHGQATNAHRTTKDLTQVKGGEGYKATFVEGTI